MGNARNLAKLAVDSNGDVAAASLDNVTPSVGKNRIINGDMRIDQRNAGASVTPTDGQYTLDRFIYNATQSSKVTTQQNAGSVTPPAGFTNYLGVTSSSAYSIGSGDFFTVGQRIEGFNVADFGWGTANAKTVTLSFWVRSSLTGTFGGSFTNSAINRSYPFTYTISSANTWEQKSVTIAGDTSGTWLTTNGIGLRIYFGLGVGGSFSGTAGAWAAATNLSATGATSVVGTSGATFYITGVQLETGSVATDFERRPYGTELALCQRYCEVVRKNANETLIGNGFNYTNQYVFMNYFFKVTKRVEPTGTLTGSVSDLQVLETNSGWYNMTSASFQANLNVVRFNMNSAPTSKTAGQANEVRIEAASSTKIVFDAEL